MESMKIVITGHVDHGKSTLVGRLLHDTGAIPEDKLRDIEKKCSRLGKEFEHAFLLDALEEEQEQTITIDTTQIFFKSGKRGYFIIDAPGHREFLKNMVTGASDADTAILLVDAREGIMEQTKRHAYLLSLLGMDRIIVAVNKMDLVGYSESCFHSLKEQVEIMLSRLDVVPLHTIPISSKTGDNIVSGTGSMGWYSGPALLESLDSFPVVAPAALPLRFPVQDVYKWEERIIAGRVESGRIGKGEEIIFYPSMKKIRVREIKKWNSSMQEATEGECIGLTMEEQIFVERGELGVHGSAPPATTQEFRATVFWLSSVPLRINTQYKIKLLTAEARCEVALISKRLDSSTLEVIQEKASELHNTEVGELLLRAEKPLALDRFKELRKSGRFVIVDGYDVAGGGIVTNTLGNIDGAETS